MQIVLFQIIQSSMSTQFVKNISISNYSVYSNSSNSANFVYTQLNAKTVLSLSLYIYKKKVGDHSRGWPEGSLFDSLLHQGVAEGATPFLDCSTLPLIRTL